MGCSYLNRVGNCPFYCKNHSINKINIMRIVPPIFLLSSDVFITHPPIVKTIVIVSQWSPKKSGRKGIYLISFKLDIFLSSPKVKKGSPYGKRGISSLNNPRKIQMNDSKLIYLFYGELR